MRDRAALVETHGLEVTGAVVDGIALDIERRLTLAFDLVENAFEFIATWDRDLAASNLARLHIGQRRIDGEAGTAYDADCVTQ